MLVCKVNLDIASAHIVISVAYAHYGINGVAYCVLTRFYYIYKRLDFGFLVDKPAEISAFYRGSCTECGQEFSCLTIGVECLCKFGYPDRNFFSVEVNIIIVGHKQPVVDKLLIDYGVLCARTHIHGYFGADIFVCQVAGILYFLRLCRKFGHFVAVCFQKVYAFFMVFRRFFYGRAKIVGQNFSAVCALFYGVFVAVKIDRSIYGRGVLHIFYGVKVLNSCLYHIFVTDKGIFQLDIVFAEKARAPCKRVLFGHYLVYLVGNIVFKADVLGGKAVLYLATVGYFKLVIDSRICHFLLYGIHG